MAFIIVKEKCTACGVCQSVCVQGAITEDGETYKVDPSKCDNCGKCMEVCGSDAITGNKG